jgi:hypothetical protein
MFILEQHISIAFPVCRRRWNIPSQ